MEDKEIFGRWKNLRTLVCVETERVHVSEGGRTEVQTRYYISDEDFPLAQYYGELARGHWGIENGLHRHLDVTFKEDKCRARKRMPPRICHCSGNLHSRSRRIRRIS